MTSGIRSSGGRIVPSPCSESEKRRNFVACQQQDTGSGIPIGSVVFWGLPITSLPAGCVLADGVANATSAGGSGIKCTEKFLYPVRSNPGDGEEADVIPEGGGHPHVMRSTTASPTVTVHSETTGLMTDIGGKHPHANNILDGGNHYHDTGAHGHESEVGYGTTIKWLENGDHVHSVDLAPLAITGHSVAACFRDHPEHTHNVPIDAGNGTAGTDENLAETPTTPDGSLGHTATNPTAGLPHNEHSHMASITPKDGGHTHAVDVNKHFHPSDVVAGELPIMCNGRQFPPGPGHHCHYGGAHSHTLTISPDGDHKHPMDDPGHYHDAHSKGVHDHGIELNGGEHTHTAGTPYHVYMVPIERIF